MKLCIKANADDKTKGVQVTGHNSITIALYVQDGSDKDNLVGEIELVYKDDVGEYGNSLTEEYKPDQNEWLVLYRARIDDYTDADIIRQGHVYPATNKTTSRKR